MQTHLLKAILETPEGQEADRILRTCVHCGFCTATCPTFQLLGDELDGPRGRIYLIKQVLEGQQPTRRTQLHLDRCLSCRACETTCPSGVEYARLADIGRARVAGLVRRPLKEQLLRLLLRKLIPYPERFGRLLALGHLAKPLLPSRLRAQIPQPQQAGARPACKHRRRMLLLEGCVQQAATPATNTATARLLDRLNISLISDPDVKCCGAVSHHLSAEAQTLQAMRNNIDAWWPHLEAGAEAIVISASGCGAMVKEYGQLLRNDSAYGEKAVRISALARDLSEVLAAEELSPLHIDGGGRLIAYHAPCSLQHGQQLPGLAEEILQRLNFRLAPVTDSHLCCGSAGTYSLLQPELSQRLLAEKLGHLCAAGPEVIATANIGCQLHLASRSTIPVRHWIELLDEALPLTRNPTTG